MQVITKRWTVLVPIAAFVLLVLAWGRSLSTVVVVVVALLLVGAILAAVHHAEVVAERVGEPFGALILAVAVTIIEVGLIVTLMVSGGGEKTQSLARDTVFAAVMITCNGIMGVSLLVGSLRRGRAVFNPEGAGAALTTVATITTLCLVLPTFTAGKPGPQFTSAQLAFAGTASLVLYGVFVTVQTVRHRTDFLPVPFDADLLESSRPDSGRAEAGRAEAGRAGSDDGSEAADRVEQAAPLPDEAAEVHQRPTARATVFSLGLLLIALIAVVGEAKLVSPSIESGVRALGMPQPVVGVIIAMLVLAPETVAAVRAARADRVQTSLNLALGSAIASIGLTIPAIAIASRWLDGPLLLGLDPLQVVLFALTVVVGILTVVPGRATLLQAGVHLSIFAAFLFLAINP
ncbi:calcium:proton antiporter [Hamadaea tsunoensis]|uniref:calcium:proton antiporter n=1 Tax=Hamadaea tsunoensis TaxID=53368 RepID=UPI0004007768|nr:ionic transporter y4hA [Hamadaea tsunoensis]